MRLYAIAMTNTLGQPSGYRPAGAECYLAGDGQPTSDPGRARKFNVPADAEAYFRNNDMTRCMSAEMIAQLDDLNVIVGLIAGVEA